MIGLLLACGMAFAGVAGGTAATYLDRRPWPLGARVAIGACLAFTLLSLPALPLASLFGLTPLTALLATLISASPLIVLARTAHRRRMAADIRGAGVRLRDALAGRDRSALIIFGLLALFALVLLGAWHQALLQTADGIQTRSRANRSDITLHVGIISRFVWGDNFPPEHPEFAGAPLTYPFMVNLGAALLVAAGATLQHALFVQNAVLVLGVIALIYYWVRELTGSRLAALFSPPLVLVGSGLGWLWMLRDFITAGTGPIEFLMNLPHAYTLQNANMQWGNLVTTLMLPQRSLLLGLPLMLLVMTLWWRAIGERHAESRHESDKPRTRGP